MFYLYRAICVRSVHSRVFPWRSQAEKKNRSAEWLYGGGAALLCLALLFAMAAGRVCSRAIASRSAFGRGIVDVSVEAHPRRTGGGAGGRRRLETIFGRSVGCSWSLLCRASQISVSRRSAVSSIKDVQARQALMERLEAAEKTRREEQKPTSEAAHEKRKETR